MYSIVATLGAHHEDHSWQGPLLACFLRACRPYFGHYFTAAAMRYADAPVPRAAP